MSQEWFLLFGNSHKMSTGKVALREKCPNTGKCGPERTPRLDSFYAVLILMKPIKTDFLHDHFLNYFQSRESSLLSKSSYFYTKLLHN